MFPPARVLGPFIIEVSANEMEGLIQWNVKQAANFATCLDYEAAVECQKRHRMLTKMIIDAKVKP
jgi:hypothetical protein